MPPKFGTSGLRGKVAELTDPLCAAYARAFLSVTPHSGLLLVGRDNRPSSERIGRAVAAGAGACGVRVADCGALPTPALALAAMARGAPSIMVTGSHIPADRNGLKFYTAEGEITKADEVAIGRALAGEDVDQTPDPVGTEPAPEALDAYRKRYLDHFGEMALSGLRIGVYEHSSVARDLLAATLAALGADVVRLGRSESFVPVDTEAVSADLRATLRKWAKSQRLDAIVSTDGDADRPLVAGADGEVIPGDILGLLTATSLGARTVVTPVSSNTMTEASGRFAKVVRTRIGSPHVIAAMKDLGPQDKAVGFEANGGFLLGFPVAGPKAPLQPLMTRDAFLPILAPLAAARLHGSLGDLLAGLPVRHTASDRLQEVPTERSAALVAELSGSAGARGDFFAARGKETRIDLTDGLRVSFADGAIVHLRPSGNAPELRCYAEARSAAEAVALVAETLGQAARFLATDRGES